MRRAFGAILVVSALVLLAPGAAFAQTYGTGGTTPPGPPSDHGTPSVEGTVVTPPTVLGTTVTQRPQVKSEVGTLPFTGADVVVIALVGGALVLGGALFVRAGRRRAHPRAA
ncbi:MAG: hypothetical protein C4321_04625 [Chloroflexota bacterium]